MAILKIEAEIISLNKDDFIIKIKNSETKEELEVNNVRDYAEYLIQSVNNTKCDHFVAKWLPSPKASQYHIDLIGMQLSMMQKWMDEELQFSNAQNEQV